MKYLNKILRAKVVQGYEQGKTDEEIADSLKISRKTVVEIKLLEIACKLSQGFTELEIAERFHKPVEEIHRNKHNYILRRFSDSSSNNSISEIPPSSRIDSISQQIGGTKAYVLEKIIIQKLKKMENIEDITKSVSISLGETKKIIEDYAIKKIHQGYTREELNSILPVSLDGYPRILETFKKVEKNNKLEGESKNTNTLLLKTQPERVLEQLSFEELVKKLRKGIKIGDIATELDWTSEMVRHRMAEFIIQHSIKGMSKEEIGNQLCLTQTDIKVLPYQYIRDYKAMYHQIQRIAEKNGSTLAQIYKIYVEGGVAKGVSINEIACTLKINEEAVQKIVNKIQNESQPELNSPEPPIIEKAIS